jgi:hypothetical protein
MGGCVHVTRRQLGLVLAVVGVPVLVWGPSIAARHYASSAQSTDYLARPDKGWHFLYDAVRLSRGAKLGSGDRALGTARRIWRHTDSVELVYLDGPVTIPVPPGGLAAPERLRTLRTRSPLVWFVHGRVRGHARQVIGLLDYHSGRTAWDLRRVAGAVGT